jgi:arsenite methyltransferase
MSSQKQKEVQEYYGQTIKKTEDLKTTACCTSEKPSSRIIKALKNLHPKILGTYYGCGLVIPDSLEGLTVLDLGCGTGHDVYLLSQFVGESGHVIGLDMTKEQLEVAREYQDYHQKQFGHQESNVEFIEGFIEDMSMIPDDSIDVIVSNCVVNLSQNKEQVFKEAYRVLKEGGEFYFSDVYANRRIPQELQDNPILWGECLSGALYWNDFLHLVRKVGFNDSRLVKSRLISPSNDELEKLLEGYRFYSATYRLFKIPELEYDCENYGQSVMYIGEGDSWSLDNHHTFAKDVETSVCGNTYLMIAKTRFCKYFDLRGSFDNHLGIYPECGKNIPFEESLCGGGSGCC